jgi:hypothetical protein
MEIAVVILIIYAVTAAIGVLILVSWWFSSMLSAMFSIHSIDHEPKWAKILRWYCAPVGWIFVFSLFVGRGVKMLAVVVRSRHQYCIWSRKRRGGSSILSPRHPISAHFKEVGWKMSFEVRGALAAERRISLLTDLAFIYKSEGSEEDKILFAAVGALLALTSTTLKRCGGSPTLINR